MWLTVYLSYTSEFILTFHLIVVKLLLILKSTLLHYELMFKQF